MVFVQCLLQYFMSAFIASQYIYKTFLVVNKDK